MEDERRHCLGSKCSYQDDPDGREQVRCTLCNIWHHNDCVNEPLSGLVWTCPKCSTIAPLIAKLQDDVALIKETNITKIREVQELKDNQAQMMELLKKISTQLDNESQLRMKAEQELAGARSQLTELNKQLADQQIRSNELKNAPPTDPSQLTPSAPPLPPSLLLGTSLLRNVDPKKVKNWDIIAKGGAKIEDLQKAIEAIPDDKTYEKVVIVAGSIDIEDKSEHDVILNYQSLAVSASLRSQNVVISSILPRTDKDLGIKTKSINDKLNEMCNKDGFTFVNNDSSFLLMNGKVNEANLTKDGLHLTKRGVDHLLTNLEVLENGSFFTPTAYPKPDNSNVVLFRGHKNPLSNFFRVEITYNGEEFSSTEAAYQFSKAKAMHDNFNARRIQSAKTGLHAMRIAEKVETDGNWKAKKVKVMEGILKQKLRVSEKTKKALIETGSKEIKEDTHHEFWGRGKEDKGQNMLGKIWMGLRDKLKKDPNFPGDLTVSQPRSTNWTQRQSWKRNWATRQRQPRCYQCGESGHGESQCRQRQTLSCWSCGLAGHKRKHCEDFGQHARKSHWDAY